MKRFDIIILIYFIICVILCSLFTIAEYGLNGTLILPTSRIITEMFFPNLLYSMLPCCIFAIIIDMKDQFRIWKIVNLAIMLIFLYCLYFGILY